MFDFIVYLYAPGYVSQYVRRFGDGDVMRAAAWVGNLVEEEFPERDSNKRISEIFEKFYDKFTRGTSRGTILRRGVGIEWDAMPVIGRKYGRWM